MLHWETSQTEVPFEVLSEIAYNLSTALSKHFLQPLGADPWVDQEDTGQHGPVLGAEGLGGGRGLAHEQVEVVVRVEGWDEALDGVDGVGLGASELKGLMKEFLLGFCLGELG